MGEYSNLFVCLMGMGTVFFGLICIVFLTEGLSRLCRVKQGTPSAVPSAPAEDSNRQEMIAAISAAVAEELGAGPAGIRIVSLKKL